MAIGEHNACGTTRSCTVINSEHAGAVLEACHELSAAAGWPERGY
jgi:hypothetical protein